MIRRTPQSGAAAADALGYPLPRRIHSEGNA
jgi:hypothetical protein